MLTVVRPGGGDHRFVYDALGRLEHRDEYVDGQWQPTAFEYDLAGNTTAVARPNGMREEFDYDPYGRLIEHRSSRDGTDEGTETFEYHRGQVIARTDSIRDATESYGYDFAGRLTSIAFPFGESMTAEYDIRSRVVAESLESPAHGLSRGLGYEYDLANRVVYLGTDEEELLAAWSFTNGVVEQIEYGNGLTRTFEVDAATGAMLSANTENDSAQVVETTQVEITVETAPERQQIRSSTTTVLGQTVERYSLTRGGHLSTADGYVGQRVFGWDDETGHSRAFAYDEMSNQIDNPDGDTFEYNTERNRLISVAIPNEGVTLNYTYDEAGFATSRGGIPMTWTATGKLASFGTDSIDWDMRGRPIATTIGGTHLAFVYFGGRIASDPTTGALLPLDLGVVRIDLSSPDRIYRHDDFRQNVSFTSDESGTIVSHYGYSPYGIDTILGSADDAVRFVGRQEIGELMWLGERIYDPIAGRFLSPDPVFNLINQFTYTLGNPVHYWDPDGLRALRQSERHTIRAASLVLAGAALAGCVGCAWWALALTVLLFLDEVANGGSLAPPAPSIAGTGSAAGIGSIGGVGLGAPACGLIGIEPVPFLALLWRRSRRRRVHIQGGN